MCFNRLYRNKNNSSYAPDSFITVLLWFYNVFEKEFSLNTLSYVAYNIDVIVACTKSVSSSENGLIYYALSQYRGMMKWQYTFYVSRNQFSTDNG